MFAKLINTSILISFNVSILLSQNIPYDSKLITTSTMSIRLTNINTLDQYYNYDSPLRWINGDYEVIWSHGLWFNGIANDSLIGTTSSYLIDFSPGPIIGGLSAMLIHPEDSLLYRIYHIDSLSGFGDPDYDQWPVQWGAPCNPDGSPKMLGNQTTYMVYNDLHPGEEYRGWPFSSPTPLEIHETVWDYGTNAGLDNIVFFRYQIYNKGSEDISEAVISLWADIDLYDPLFNWGGYNPIGNYMYNYYWNINAGYLPRACAYVMLQGPVVPAIGETAHSFGQQIPDARNLNTTAGWYIYDESDPDPDSLAYMPYTFEQLRNISLGLMMNGNPIIHPLTNDTTTYTYDGDPVTGEGWIWNLDGMQGGSGIITSSGTFSLLAGDSTEVIYALLVVPEDSFQEALTNLENQTLWLRQWWEDNQLKSDDGKNNLHPIGSTFLTTFPNPFNESINIQWIIPCSEFVEISLYNILGRKLENIYISVSQKGVTQIKWQPMHLSSGTYIIDFKTNNEHKYKKITLLK